MPSTQGGKVNGTSQTSSPTVKRQKTAFSTETEAFIAGAISEALAKQQNSLKDMLQRVLAEVVEPLKRKHQETSRSLWHHWASTTTSTAVSTTPLVLLRGRRFNNGAMQAPGNLWIK